MTRYIMLQGTSSNVGKSILATALCRIFLQDGRHVAPFKAQNMALNSYVTKDGKEMGRAQVAQAEAAGLDPDVDMNPVLLKPTGNASSQVVLLGRPIGNMSARDYHKGYSTKLFGEVKAALARLEEKYDTVVIEGAGSPAEVNLKANDIVNMAVARYLHAPVLLIADIDRGGALASLVGTLELLTPEERDLVKGLIINKFRGDVTLLQPAVEFLEEKTGKPVLGIVPHVVHLGIDDEDSVALETKGIDEKKADIKIAVIKTPKISNFTDFECLSGEEDVSVSYIDLPEEIEKLGKIDLIMLPGSKNTTEDMIYIRRCGLEAKIKEKVTEGTPLIGICGGYQMLGKEIRDPNHTESQFDGTPGLGLLDMVTTFSAEKLTSQVIADCHGLHFLGQTIDASGLHGYEIHMGETEFTGMGDEHPLVITERANEAVQAAEGTVRADGLVFGTYIHGIFDHDEFRRSVINALRIKKGLPALENKRNVYAEKQRAYDNLAEKVRAALDMDKLYKILGEQ